MAILHSRWAAAPIEPTDALTHDNWAGARENQMPLPAGFMWVKNDGIFASIALDLVKDRNNDPGTGDYFWLSFDKDRNGAITPNVDVNYGLYPGQPNKMGRQFYLGPNVWSGLLNEVSTSACKIAFEASPNDATPHRIWKIRIRLSDIGVALNPWWLWAPFTKFGLKTTSTNPAFNQNSPANFSSSFSSLHTLYFARNAGLPSADLGPVMGSVGLIATTKIASATGKATTAAGNFIVATNDAFGGLLNVIGNRTQMQTLWAAGARKYLVKHRAGGVGAFANLHSAWHNYKWGGSDYVLESFGADAADHYP